jgi:hypothetical protein
MALKTIEQLAADIEVIANETARGNSKTRIATILQDLVDSLAVTLTTEDDEGQAHGIFCEGTFDVEGFRLRGAAAVATAAQTVAADAGQGWVTFGSCSAPADDTTVDDYIVRAHGYKVGNPGTVYIDESVLLRVTADGSGNAIVLGGLGGIFNAPQLGVAQAGATLLVGVRADAADDWHWRVAIYPTRAPFDGAKQSSEASTIGTGSSWHTEITIPGPAHDGDQLEVAYAVRGRFNTGGAVWSFIRARGILVVERSNGALTIADHVTTWSDARIRAELNGANLLIQSQQHATENWIVQADATSRLVGV